jgi:hypothetical protein
VVTRHENTEVPGFLQKHIDHRRVLIEPANSTSIADLRKIGDKQGRYTLSAENGRGKLFAKPAVGADWEEVFWCIDVNHWHSKSTNPERLYELT